jgi:hypothetical protein
MARELAIGRTLARVSPTLRWAYAMRLGVVLFAVLSLAACGGDDSAARPLVEEIPAAVEALEAELGSPQAYFEINADPAKVTLWVASDEASEATPWVFADGELSQADEPQDAEGETFTAEEGLTFESDTVLDQVLADFGDKVQQFSIVGGAGDTVRFGAIVQSDRGGQLDVGLGPDGEIVEASAVS